MRESWSQDQHGPSLYGKCFRNSTLHYSLIWYHFIKINDHIRVSSGFIICLVRWSDWYFSGGWCWPDRLQCAGSDWPDTACTAQTGGERHNKSINCFFLFLDRPDQTLHYCINISDWTLDILPVPHGSSLLPSCLSQTTSTKQFFWLEEASF